ncbi:MAG: response regulator [Nitrospirota bacterium]
MFKVLVADNEHEDRELLKLEIKRALSAETSDIRFSEASSVRQALQLLTTQTFDLMTLDIEFDRLNEGIEALPEIFENYPTLNVIIVSGKLDKSEVLEQVFRFTKDNVLKGKRWSRHFDVLDKKDDKKEALLRAYTFALKQNEGADRIRELFLLAESYLEKGMLEKCQEIYRKIQDIAPGEQESGENIRMFKSSITHRQALEYYRKGDVVVGSLLLGHYLENRLKSFTGKVLGRNVPVLSDCLKELERSGISKYKRGLFQRLYVIRNTAIHQPGAVTEKDFEEALKNLDQLEDQLL